MNAVTSSTPSDDDALCARLAQVLSAGELIRDLAERELYSSDVYARYATAAVIVRTRDRERLARAVGVASAAGYDVVPRGGGMSYTGGYAPRSERSVIVDVGALDRIVDIDAENMVVVAEAGVTWKQLDEQLRAQGLRLPFFGTFSGARATVGGGLSNGALFFGTARYGTAADNVLGLEIVLADGSIVRTGQTAFGGATKSFYRTHGPDLTGLFTHDGGAFGIKVQAAFRLIRAPAHTGFASFVFPDAAATARALSEVSRSGAAEEAYVFDPASTQRSLSEAGLAQDLRALASVIKAGTSQGAGGWLRGLKDGAKLVAAGRDFIDAESYSLHLTCAARSAASLEADLDACREAAAKFGGREIANSIPKAARAMPFPSLNGVLGPAGERWAALNAKVAHGDAVAFVAECEALIAGHATEMQRLGVTASRLFIGMGTHAFSYEPVFHWRDTWLPVHERIPEPGHLAKLARPAPNPAASELVERMRRELIAIFVKWGAASNQIGRTYAYRSALKPETAHVVTGIKQVVDPQGRMNPGVLELG